MAVGGPENSKDLEYATGCLCWTANFSYRLVTAGQLYILNSFFPLIFSTAVSAKRTFFRELPGTSIPACPHTQCSLCTLAALLREFFMLQLHKFTDSFTVNSGRIKLFKQNKNNNNNNLNTYIHELTRTLYVATYRKGSFTFKQRSTQRNKENDLVNKVLPFLLECLGTKTFGGGFLLPAIGVLGMKFERGNDLWHLRERPSANWASQIVPDRNVLQYSLEEWLWRRGGGRRVFLIELVLFDILSAMLSALNHE